MRCLFKYLIKLEIVYFTSRFLIWLITLHDVYQVN